ncbi:MAG TPA: polyprenol monophosphomannose synthase [Pyrinomonadaceae bacterium]|jgi:glycosyltransferase involved in cell wall biosynthesis
MSVEERKGRPRRIWAVLPTYNEAENVAPLVTALLSLPLDLHVVVVDDASPDGTADVAEGAGRGSARLEVIRREGERGLGTAYLAGFRRAAEAGAEAVLTMDCDFSHDPAAVPSLVAALDSARVVIGSRYVAGGRIENWGLYRKALSAAANRFVRALFRLPVSDCTSGFRLYRAEVLAAVPWERVSSTGYSFLVESLYWAMRGDGARVREVPICFLDRVRGQSKMGAREILSGVVNLLRLRADLFRRQ